MYLTKLQREMIMLAGIKGGAIREFVRATDDLTPEESRRLPIREIAKQSSEKLVKEDDLYTMAEFLTWAICQNVDCQSPFRCTVEQEGKSFRKCRLYNAMISLGLARASYVKGQCPYKL